MSVRFCYFNQADEGLVCAILTASIGQRAKQDSVSVVGSFATDSSQLDLLIPWAGVAGSVLP